MPFKASWISLSYKRMRSESSSMGRVESGKSSGAPGQSCKRRRRKRPKKRLNNRIVLRPIMSLKS